MESCFRPRSDRTALQGILSSSSSGSYAEPSQPFSSAYPAYSARIIVDAIFDLFLTPMLTHVGAR